MAQCPKCKRNLPVSGKCPTCEGKPAFSLGSFLRPGENAPGQPTTPAAQPGAGAPPVSDNHTAPLPPPRPVVAAVSPPPVAAPPPPPGGDAAGGTGHTDSILASLRARVGGSAAAPAETGAAMPNLLDDGGADASPMPIPAATGAPLPGPRPVGPAPRAGTPGVTPPPAPAAGAGAAYRPPPLLNETPPARPTPAPPSAEALAAEAQALPAAINLNDEEMECTMLSGILTDPFILDKALAAGLVPELFSTRYSRAVCRAILLLRDENKEGSLIDRIILKNKLKQQNLWDDPMQQFLNRVLAQPTPTLNQVLHYLNLLKEQALKRKLKDIAGQISDYVDHPDPQAPVSLEHFANKVVTEVRAIQRAKTQKRINLVKEEMRDIIKDIERREREGEVQIIGYSFAPFNLLNQALSGFRKGFMYAIAGAPRRGKTTFTLEMATNVATNCKIPVLFFTYEQTKKNLTYRLLAKESRLNPDSLQRKKIRSDMIMDAKFMGGWKKMQEYMDYFYIVEATKEDTVDRIRSYAYNVMQDFNTEDLMIFVDYIQKMPLSRNYQDEKFKVEEISTELKALSIELRNPIMVISSLSKEGCFIDATESAERPTMYHCKGSGDIEYDLDCAMIQAKDWADTKEICNQLRHKAEEIGKDPTRIPKVDVVNLYLDKNRDAPEGIFSVMQYLFFIEDNKFIELGPKYEDEQFRFSKVEQLVNQLIEQNYIVFHDKDRSAGYQKGRVQIKLKNV